MAQGGLRKRPLQERSRATINRILNTASRLLVEVGYEALATSPTMLLQESGVSRGSFYSFFETPEKVLDELAFQCMQDSVEQFEDMVGGVTPRHWHDVVDGLIAFYRKNFRNPLVRELWVRQNLTPPVRAADREWMQDVAGRLLAALQAVNPAFAELSERQALVAIEMCERLFQYAYTDDPDGDEDIVGEIRVVLCSYFSHYEQDVRQTPRRRVPIRRGVAGR